MSSWWSLLMGFIVSTGLMAAAVLVVAVVLPPISNTMREKPSAPKFAFARWTDCDAAGGRLATRAMRVPRGVVVRTADAQGADTVLVPIRRYREAERFLAELGCRLPGGR